MREQISPSVSDVTGDVRASRGNASIVLALIVVLAVVTFVRGGAAPAAVQFSPAAASALLGPNLRWLAAGPARATPPRAIPWLDRPLLRAPAHPPLAPACRAANLHAPLFLQGATGSLVGGVTLTNRGRACALVGWPRAAFAGSAAQATKWQVRRVASSFEPPNPLADPPGSLRALARGKSARVALVWSNWCGPGSEAAGSSGERPTALVLTLASKTRLRLPLTRAPRCDSPTTPSKLTVEPFRPFVRQLPPSSQLPLRLAVVRRGSTTTNRGLVLLRASRGTLLRYSVSLTNTSVRPFRFAACPAYVEQLSDTPPRAYVLNCRPAGTIAPRATRLFAIALPISSNARLGSSELTFQLAPRTFNAPIAQAAVLVVR